MTAGPPTLIGAEPVPAIMPSGGEMMAIEIMERKAARAAALRAGDPEEPGR